MKKQLKAWQLILDSLRENIPVMLLYVLESSGSSPGRQGFFMAVNANAEMEGSIGGGIMEHKFVEMARGKLLAIGHELLAPNLRKQIHHKAAATDQSGMICSGEQTILLYPVSKKDIPVIEKIIDSLSKNKNGTLQLSPPGPTFSEESPDKNFFFQMKSEEDWEFREKTGYKNQLSIIGGGHCALSFSQLMSGMDFYIRVYDERNDLKTMVENEWAHEKHFVSDYNEMERLIQPGSDHYVVIMTFGYRTDDLALRALLNRKFKYLGLLGSRSKIEKTFEDYRKEGITEELLKRIHTPIGISIKSQTPEEIAVSIAAEIIKVKNQEL